MTAQTVYNRRELLLVLRQGFGGNLNYSKQVMAFVAPKISKSQQREMKNISHHFITVTDI